MGIVGRLDLHRYAEQVRSVEGHVGRPAVDPKPLVSLWIYSYSCGVSSARAIERLCEHDPASVRLIAESHNKAGSSSFLVNVAYG